MASRFTFGGYGGDQVTQDPAGNSGFFKAAANYASVGTFWSAQTGGTQYTDLVDPNNGFIAITGISTDAHGDIVPFQGPAGIGEGWVDFGRGRFKVIANEGVDAIAGDRVNTPGSNTRTATDALYTTGGEVRSKSKPGSTDQTSTVQGELQSLYNAGGGTLILPSSAFGAVTIKVTNLTLPNDGTTIAKMPSIIIKGQGGHTSGVGSTPTGGTILEFTGTDTYGLIKSNGIGRLTIRDLTLQNKNVATTTPFIYTTNTTLLVCGVGFVGANAGTAANQDAIVLGGPNQVQNGSGWTDGFQGYGTVISENYFSNIRAAVKGQAYANAVVVRDNTIWSTCGNPAGAAIEWDGKPTTGTQTAAGNVISGNLIEVTNYQYAIRLKNSSQSTVTGNNVYDASATTSVIYFLDATTSGIVLQEGYSSPGKPVLTDNGTNNWFTPSSQGIYGKQPPTDFADINYPTKAYGMRAYGPGGYLFQPLATMPDTSLVFNALRGPTEATDPGGAVYQIAQNGSVTIGASAASGGNMTGPFCNFTAGGRTWSGVGTAAGQTNGANMSQDSGPGGSYFDMKNYAVRFYDFNAGPLRMRVGAGKDGFDLGSASDVTVQRDANAALAVNAAVKTKATTTAARPTAASVGVGGQLYDTTLSKPIWSDGTVFRDASGTAV